MLPQMPYYSFILPSVFVNGAPRALIAQTKSNQSQRREGLGSYILASILRTDGREGPC